MVFMSYQSTPYQNTDMYDGDSKLEMKVGKVASGYLPKVPRYLKVRPQGTVWGNVRDVEFRYVWSARSHENNQALEYTRPIVLDIAFP